MKAVVIFANSVKNHNHCVAGKEVDTQIWIRPVSDCDGGALSCEQCLAENIHGKFKVSPLQKIEMGLAQPVPLINQPENHLISGKIWQQKYNINKNEIPHYLDAPDSLWGAGNKVEYAQIEGGLIKIDQSLYLVRVGNLQLTKVNSKRRATFEYNGVPYDLPATDPNFDQQLEKPNNQQILCVSLGEKFDPDDGNNYSCYKIVAAIL